MKLFFVLLLHFPIFPCLAQAKILYHEIELTASVHLVVQWNILAKNFPPAGGIPFHYIKETIDPKGRVTELKFLDRSGNFADATCFEPIWLQYQYPNDTTVILITLNEDGNKICDIECGVPDHSTYFLSRDQKRIKNVLYKCLPDTAAFLKAGFTREEIRKSIHETEETEYTNYIEGYEYSFAKLNGKFPVGKDFKNDDLLWSAAQKNSIQKALSK